MATTESMLRGRILRAIRRAHHRRDGVLVFGYPASLETGPGHPDLFGVVRGFHMALEVKTRTGKPTPLQVQRLMELRECGAYAWIVRTEEQALAAIRWILRGGRAPMSNEPIDINDWLNSPGEETDFAEGAMAAVAGVTDADVAQAQTALDIEAEEAGGADDLLETFPTALSAPVENGTVSYEPEPLPDFEDLAQPAPEMTHAEKLANLDARDAALDGDDPANESHDTRVFHSMLRNEILGARAETRAVGDRVTLVFETINRLETDVAAFGKMFRALLVAMEIDESELPVIPPAEPKRTRRARKAE